MKIIVTGGAGFIASHVTDLYIADGHDVIVIDNLSTGRLSNINPRARFYQLDIRSPEVEQIFKLEKPDIVNHHAAQMDVRKSVVEPSFDAEVNILGSIRLIEYARQYSVRRFIYISSGGAAYGEPVYLPCDENHPVDPICPYGASKHTVEHYLYMYHINYGLEYTVLRYPNVFGPRQDPKGEAGVVAIFTGQMLADKPVTIFGDGDQERDFVYVGDCARANLLALEAGHPSGIYNLGSSTGTTIHEVYAVLKRITGYSREAIYAPAKIGETRRIFLAAGKVKLEYGWEPEVSFIDGLRQTVDYFKIAEMEA